MIIGSPGCLYLCCSSSSSPPEKKSVCVRWDRRSLLVCRGNWSQVCLNSFGKKKLWGNETAGPDPVQPGCRLLSAVFMASGPCFQPDALSWRKWAILGRWYMMQTSASIAGLSWRAIETFYCFSSGKKKKSQREVSVLNQPCWVISHKKWSSCLRLGMLHLFRYFSCHIDDLCWWFALLAPEVYKMQTCLCAWRQIETLIWSMESLPLSYSSHPYVLAVSRVLWTTEQIVGRFIGETVRQLGTHHKAKQMFRWLGKEVNGKERNDSGGWQGKRWCGRKGCRGMMEAEKNELIYWRKNSETSLAIPCQPLRWAKCFPLSLGHRSLFRLPYWFTH